MLRCVVCVVRLVTRRLLVTVHHLGDWCKKSSICFGILTGLHLFSMGFFFQSTDGASVHEKISENST